MHIYLKKLVLENESKRNFRSVLKVNYFYIPLSHKNIKNLTLYCIHMELLKNKLILYILLKNITIKIKFI